MTTRRNYYLLARAGEAAKMLANMLLAKRAVSRPQRASPPRALLLLLLLLLAPRAPATPEIAPNHGDKPHIVYFMVDDWGWN